MRKFIIYDLAKKAYVAEKDGQVFFSYNHTEATGFLKYELARQFLEDIVLPLVTQVNKENAFWCSGFALTVLEVYV
jgi:hypothetical protein